MVTTVPVLVPVIFRFLMVPNAQLLVASTVPRLMNKLYCLPVVSTFTGMAMVSIQLGLALEVMDTKPACTTTVIVV